MDKKLLEYAQEQLKQLRQPTLAGRQYEENVPDKCKKCIHRKTSDYGTDYCDYTEYHTNIGVPVPYPYFFKQDYPCKGHMQNEIIGEKENEY